MPAGWIKDRIKAMFRKEEWIEYDAYARRIRFLEELYFQQAVRKQSIRNMQL